LILFHGSPHLDLNIPPFKHNSTIQKLQDFGALINSFHHTIWKINYYYPHGYSFKKYLTHTGTLQIIDIFHIASRIAPNMFRDKASILMEAKSKRKPISATSVVGTGLLSVQQKKDNVSL
jgi:hypothetical protein